MATLPKLLPQITTTSDLDFAGTDTGGAFTATLSAATFDSMLELCSALQTAINAEATDTFTVAVSSGGIVTISADAAWTVTWGSTDDALSKSLLGFAETESVSAQVLTATKRHYKGFYSPVGIAYAPWIRRLPRRMQRAEDGSLALYAAGTTLREGEIVFAFLTEAQAEAGGTDSDGAGNSVDWTDRTLLDFWEEVADKPFRLYLDATDGTVASPGTEDTEYFKCKRTDDTWAPEQIDPESWTYYRVGIPLALGV